MHVAYPFMLNVYLRALHKQNAAKVFLFGYNILQVYTEV